jgi:hypothetical protein
VYSFQKILAFQIHCAKLHRGADMLSQTVPENARVRVFATFEDMFFACITGHGSGISQRSVTLSRGGASRCSVRRLTTFAPDLLEQLIASRFTRFSSDGEMAVIVIGARQGHSGGDCLHLWWSQHSNLGQQSFSHSHPNRPLDDIFKHSTH